MDQLVDMFIAWQVAGLSIGFVLALLYVQGTYGRLAALAGVVLPVCTVLLVWQMLIEAPKPNSDPTSAVVAESIEWTTNLNQGWSVR
jgi:hypothetical protein